MIVYFILNFFIGIIWNIPEESFCMAWKLHLITSYLTRKGW